MITERLTDPQFTTLALAVMAIGIAGLIAVCVWRIEFREPRVDRGGFQ